MKNFKEFLTENTRNGLITIHTKDGLYDGVTGAFRMYGKTKDHLSYSITINSTDSGKTEVITSINGNGRYSNAKELQKEVNDIADIAAIEEALQKLASLKIGDSEAKLKAVTDKFKGTLINYEFYEVM